MFPNLDKFDFRNYYEVKHAACGHHVDKIAIEHIDINGGYPVKFELPRENPTGPILYSHPRWCGACRRSRKFALERLQYRRLATLSDMVGGCEKKKIMVVAYVQGVIQGRIFALNTPIEENKECGDTAVEDDGSVEQLVDLLVGAHLDKDGHTEELATIMENATLIDNEHTEVQLEGLENNEMNQGFEDGRGLQAKMEGAAMSQVDQQTRETLLQRALL